MSQKRTYDDGDSDYQQFGTLSGQQAKRQKLLELDAQATTIKKMEDIISREFEKEIRNKEEEIDLIDERLNEGRRMLDRLRASIIAQYYSRAAQGNNESLSASATTSVMHPAVKKLYGKTVRMPASATISKLDPDPIANKSVKEEPGTQISSSRDGSSKVRLNQVEHGDRSIESRLGTNFNEGRLGGHSSEGRLGGHSKENSEAVRPADPSNEGRRGDHLKTIKKLIVGNISNYLSSERREIEADPNRPTHRWMVYVRGGKDERMNLNDFIKYVDYHLHESYAPDHIVRTKYPFQLTRRGWGEFTIKVDVHLRGPKKRVVQVVHQLKLDRTYSGLQTLGQESTFTVELDDPAEQRLAESLADPGNDVEVKEEALDIPINDIKVEPMEEVERRPIQSALDTSMCNKNGSSTEIHTNVAFDRTDAVTQSADINSAVTQCTDVFNCDLQIKSEPVSPSQIDTIDASIVNDNTSFVDVDSSETVDNRLESNCVDTINCSPMFTESEHLVTICPDLNSEIDIDGLKSSSQKNCVQNSIRCDEPVGHISLKKNFETVVGSRDEEGKTFENVEIGSVEAVLHGNPSSHTGLICISPSKPDCSPSCRDGNSLSSDPVQTGCVSSEQSHYVSSQQEVNDLITVETNCTTTRPDQDGCSFLEQEVISSLSDPVQGGSSVEFEPDQTSSKQQETNNCVSTGPILDSLATLDSSAAIPGSRMTLDSSTAIPGSRMTLDSSAAIPGSLTTLDSAAVVIPGRVLVRPPGGPTVGPTIKQQQLLNTIPSQRTPSASSTGRLVVIKTRHHVPPPRIQVSSHTTRVVSLLHNSNKSGNPLTLPHANQTLGVISKVTVGNQSINVVGRNNLIHVSSRSSNPVVAPLGASALVKSSQVRYLIVPGGGTPSHSTAMHVLSSPVMPRSPVNFRSVRTPTSAISSNVQAPTVMISSTFRTPKLMTSSGGLSSSVMSSPVYTPTLVMSSPAHVPTLVTSSFNCRPTLIMSSNPSSVCQPSNIKSSPLANLNSNLMSARPMVAAIVKNQPPIKPDALPSHAPTEFFLTRPGGVFVSSSSLPAGTSLLRPPVSLTSILKPQYGRNLKPSVSPRYRSALVNAKPAATVNYSQQIRPANISLLTASLSNKELETGNVLQDGKKFQSIAAELRPGPSKVGSENFFTSNSVSTEMKKQPVKLDLAPVGSNKFLAIPSRSHSNLPSASSSDDRQHDKLLKSSKVSPQKQPTTKNDVLRLDDFGSMEDVIRSVVRHFPLYKNPIDRSIHPYCAESLEKYLLWNVGKRRAAELFRAVAVLKRVATLLDGITSFKGEDIWTKYKLMRWCRRNQHTPLDDEILRHRTQHQVNSSTESTHFMSLSDHKSFIKQLQSSTSDNAVPNSDREVPIDVETIDISPESSPVKKQSPSKDFSVREIISPSVEAEFVQEAVNQIGIRLCPAAVAPLENPYVLSSTVEEMIAGSLRMFLVELLGRSSTLMFESDRLSTELTAADVYSALQTTDRWDFLTNARLGVPDIAEEESEETG